MFKIQLPAGMLALALTAVSGWCDDLASIKQALEAKYALTTTTADKTDIVTPGCVLVLKRSNLVTADATKPSFFGNNTYKNGRITQNRMLHVGGIGGVGKVEGTRIFVSGEKVWLTGIDVVEKDVVFSLFTDAFSDLRYKGTLKFPFEKDTTPTVNGVMAAVAEVFDIQPSDSNGGGGQQTQQSGGQMFPQTTRAQQTPPAAPSEAPPPPIAPPPPPPADPKEIKLGQTPDQVSASFGPPDRVIKLPTKQIYVYKDMKVIFVGGKVSDVQ